MGVVSATTLMVRPGRFEDFLPDARKGKALLEKYGAKNLRLMTAVVAGEATGSVILTYEVDDLTSFGAVFDKSLADPEVVELMTITDASSISGSQTTVWVDIPL
jgi:hypothetical protein